MNWIPRGTDTMKRLQTDHHPTVQNFFRKSLRHFFREPWKRMTRIQMNSENYCCEVPIIGPLLRMHEHVFINKRNYCMLFQSYLNLLAL
jgi:hypothetical protein